MKVKCEIEECELENDNGFLVDGVRATCSVCGHVTESYGTSDVSRCRCLVLMRKECPKRVNNYYVEDE